MDESLAIPDDSILYRLIVVPAGAGRDPQELSTGDFQYQKEDLARSKGYPGQCLSVAVRHTLIANSETLDVMIRERERRPGELVGVARLMAGDVRRLVGLDGSPLPHGIMFAPDAYVGHAVIFPLGEPRKGPTQKALKNIADWYISPCPVESAPWDKPTP